MDQQPQTSGRSDSIKPAEGQGAAVGMPPTDGMNGSPDGMIPEPPPPAPPLTPMGWLTQNAPYLISFAAILIVLHHYYGFDGIFRAGLVVFGLGFVIFIHELGHFATAKWCDVKVTTFSIGFGPALPGCSWQKGETTYKIALFPLGGYVQMVGEGADSDEQEDDPRSFKNKSVSQRMLIISAGVIMNVLLGAICFITVYRFHGVERPPAVVWRVDPGSPAWLKGVRTGSVITKLGKINSPFFDDLKVEVALSGADDVIPFTFYWQGKPQLIDLSPRRDENGMMPVIGVVPPEGLKLPPAAAAKAHELPTRYNSAAAAAREVPLGKGDIVLAATNPDNEGKVDPLPTDPAENGAELCRRMRKLGSDTMVLKVRHPDGGMEEVEVPAKGFAFDDAIVGTTDPDHPDDLFGVKELAPAPEYLPGEEHDPFDYRQRMRELTGKPIVIQVKRPGIPRPVNVLVAPAYHWTLGVRMKMGKVAAIRDHSPASDEVEAGDVITEVSMIDGGGSVKKIDVDPVHLASKLRRTASAKQHPGKWKVRLTVMRPPSDPNNKNALVPVVATLDWDDSWNSNAEAAVSPHSPTSIPELGIAFFVESTVDKVLDAELAGSLHEGDVIEQIRFRMPGKRVNSPEEWPNWREINSQRGQEKVFDQWAHWFWAFQHYADYPEVELKVRRGKDLLPEPVRLTAKEDKDWPLADRGIELMLSYKLQKADSIGEALIFGKDRTVGMIKQIYLNLARFTSGRISPKLLGGPIEIAKQTFSAAEDPWILTLFLGMISVNLAVVNFLPIPVLDGGHMVFLIYEKLRGKPPSEGVRAAATYFGLFLILSLMAFVFWNDIKRLLGWT